MENSQQKIQTNETNKVSSNLCCVAGIIADNRGNFTICGEINEQVI